MKTTLAREEIQAFIEKIDFDMAQGWEAQAVELKMA